MHDTDLAGATGASAGCAVMPSVTLRIGGGQVQEEVCPHDEVHPAALRRICCAAAGQLLRRATTSSIAARP